MEYKLLDIASLSPEAQRALSSGSAKMMAARGMAPLANPVDLLSVLYQLCVEVNDKIQPAAQKSAQGLPVAILSGGLADARLDSQVIDYFCTHADCRKELLDIVILNGNSADETIAGIAAIANEAQIDLIAENQLRILRSPDLIAAIYTNKRARMSTVDRVVEIAVREGVKVPAIPVWDELVRAVLQIAEEKNENEVTPSEAEVTASDCVFQELLPEGDDDAPILQETEVALRDMSIPAKIRLAMMGNKFQRGQLIRDPKKLVALAVIKAPSVKENEASQYASNNSLCEDVVAYIAAKKEWTKLYNIKLALVNNPKCPLPAAMRLLPHLRAKDLRAMARSRSIPSALAAQARKLSNARLGGKR